MRLLIMLLSLFISHAAHAQYSKDDVALLLTNGSSRDWNFKGYKKTLGPACTGSGQLFTFLKSGKMQWKRCEDGQVRFRELSYKVAPVPYGVEGEYQIELSERIRMEGGREFKTFRVDLPGAKAKKSGQQMVWRTIGDSKVSPAEIASFVSNN